MDARPQRPLRPLHAQGDENILPPTSKQAFLHQRHKSTGNLPSMLTIGGLKAAAKRTAFGDLSNVSKNLVKVHEESGIASKITKVQDDSDAITKNNVKVYQDSAIGVVNEDSDSAKPPPVPEKPAALLRPAQRPLTGGSKVTLNAAAPPYIPISVPVVSTNQQPALKRNLSKKAQVYNDNAPKVGEQSTTEDEVNTGGIPRHHKSQPQLKQEQPILRRTQSKNLDVSAQQFEVSVPPSEYSSQDQQTDFPESQAALAYMQLTEQQKTELYVPEDTPAVPEAAIAEAADHLLVHPSGPHVRYETEDYWEEEDLTDEVLNDEFGYTTLHAFMEMSQSITGGITDVILPKLTRKTVNELAAAKQIALANRSPEEADEECWDTSMVAEYGEEIFEYLLKLESKMLPDAHYMDKQAEIRWSMRAVLMDWLVQVHCRFSLLPETLFLCVNFIDRFLTHKVVSLNKLQLVGATALFVAAKYEEINCPSISEIVYMVDGGYTQDEILKAERFMLTMLSFELGYPGPMSFLRRISKADDYDLETRTLAKYFLEVTIMDERFVGSPASFIAAGAHCLARLMLRKGDWSPEHTYYSGYTWSQMYRLVHMMEGCLHGANKHHAAVYEKYTDRRYKKASLFVQSELRAGFCVPPLHVKTRPSLTVPHFDDMADSAMSEEARESFKRMVQVKA